MKTYVLLFPIVLGLFAIVAVPQSTHHFPTPPETMDPQPQDKEQITLNRHVNLEQLQRDAADLARTAQSIPTDVASVRQGMLPKDVVEKLKQIEKLSKKMRTELNP